MRKFLTSLDLKRSNAVLINYCCIFFLHLIVMEEHKVQQPEDSIKYMELDIV